jgi:hypothetical protein
VLNDQLRIHSLIESSVGFEAVDKIVHEAIARALHPAAGNDAYSNTVANTSGDGSNDPVVVQISDENKELLVKWLQDKGRVGERNECTVFFK